MFMLEEDSTAIMDRIFLSTSTDAKVLLLRNICDFLVSQTHSGPIDERSRFRCLLLPVTRRLMSFYSWVHEGNRYDPSHW